LLNVTNLFVQNVEGKPECLWIHFE